MQPYLDILTRAVEQWSNEDVPVTQAIPAKDLEQAVDVSLGESGCSTNELEQAIQQYLHYTPRSSNPEFYKLLYSGVNKEALLGDWITALSNSTMHTYQVGPMSTLMELELIRQWNALIGFSEGDGVMVSGGSQANLIGMMLARHQQCSDIKAKGLQMSSNHKPLVAYVSDQAHYSNIRSANLLGIGTDNLVSVASDEAGCICPIALEAAIERDLADGKRPFFLGLTAGTTVVGAFDDVKKCSDIARKHNIWLHIDGAWGGPVLFSKQHKSLLANSHLADSFAWDAHKFMNVPITAAVILVKHKGALKECISGGGGDYLFHSDINADYNLGERSIQCGRRADAIKVWLSWKAKGSRGFAEKVDKLQNLKTTLVDAIETSSSFQLLAPAPFLNILFRYVPNDEADEKDLSRLNIEICKKLIEKGIAYIDYAQYKGRTGIRLVLANEQTTESDLLRLLERCEQVGRDLFEQESVG